MSIDYKILGRPGKDNAVFIKADSGHALYRILFDCGDCLGPLTSNDILSLDYLLFSHLHLDHIAGFDSLFRKIYTRSTKPVLLWGPAHTASIVHHRLLGFMWNLLEGVTGIWKINEIQPDLIREVRVETGESFKIVHEEGERRWNLVVLENSDFTIEAVQMDHYIPSMAYILREKTRENIDKDKLEKMGLPAGPWLQQLKTFDPDSGESMLKLNGRDYSLEKLYDELVRITEGSSIAYLTDFLLDEEGMNRLVPVLQGCQTIICESQYHPRDSDLALKSRHMTSVQAAELAKASGAGELILFHVSDRYRRIEWVDMLREARAIFPQTRFPGHWKLNDVD